MKIIFLDVDGVLNADDDFGGRSKPNPRICGWAGISTTKVKRLKKIVDATNAKIVLVSSWKYDYRNYLKTGNNAIGKYLKNKLRKQDLYILDDTVRFDSACGEARGYEIVSWISESSEKIDSWVVLDDEVFMDYKQHRINDHLVKTDERFGLTEADVEKAIKILTEKGE